MAKVSKKSEKITAFGGKLTWGQSPCEVVSILFLFQPFFKFTSQRDSPPVSLAGSWAVSLDLHGIHNY